MSRPVVKVVEFTCEAEPSIAEHCRKYFEAKFNAQLARSRFPNSRNLGIFQVVLRREAKRQEWYQFTGFGDGLFIPHERRVVRDADGKPCLLVPDIKIVEVP